MRVGDSLISRIVEAIGHSEFVAAILSHNSVRSNWVMKELQWAMNEEIAGRRVKVLPILIERCDVPDFLRDKVYADFTDSDNFDAPPEKLLHALGVERPTANGEVEPRRKPAKPGEAEELEGFDDIRIVGIDKSRAYRRDPDKHLFHVYLELSSYPPQELGADFRRRAA